MGFVSGVTFSFFGEMSTSKMGKYVVSRKYSIFNAFASGAERKHRMHISHIILNVMHSHVQLHSHTHNVQN